MADLVLDVRLDGFPSPVGQLVCDDYGSLSFAYSPVHLSLPRAHPVSLSLPLTDEPYGDQTTRPFFDNLLQERDSTLSRVMERENLARNDIAGLLFHLGSDCSGALSVLPEGAPPVKVPGIYEADYRDITDAQLLDIVKALHLREPLPADMSDPSPLAGVQSKIAITLLPDGRFAEPLPGSGAPTTHILKVPGQRHLHDVLYEDQTMALLRGSGIPTANTQARMIGDIPALLVTRFDRALDEDGRVIRLHQEDFAQALGLPASFKYERNGEPGRRFDVSAIRSVLDKTRSPATEKLRFIATTIANLMLGNVDAHAKNHALLYQQNGHVDLAPAYDIFPTALDPQLTAEFAFRIGRANTLDALTKSDIDLFLSDLGLPSAAARGRLAGRVVQDIGTRLCEQLDDQNRPNTKRLGDMIAANISTVFQAMNIEIPHAIGNRDAFVPRGGGWTLES